MQRDTAACFNPINPVNGTHLHVVISMFNRNVSRQSQTTTDALTVATNAFICENHVKLAAQQRIACDMRQQQL